MILSHPFCPFPSLPLTSTLPSPSLSGVYPTFTSTPSDQTVTDGTTALFTCQTNGAPKPAITWRKGRTHTRHWTCLTASWRSFTFEAVSFISFGRITGLGERLLPGSAVHAVAVRWFADSAGQLAGLRRVHLHRLQLRRDHQRHLGAHRLE